MIAREKVVCAIENCIGQPKCKDCPWEGCEVEHEVVNSVPYGLLRDALALLKEQEPRILDWDEIKNYPMVYGEFRGIKEIYPLIITVDDWGRCLSWNPGINVSDEFLLVVSDEEDRRNTRCWNHMPTEEQRQAVPWDEQK